MKRTIAFLISCILLLFVCFAGAETLEELEAERDALLSQLSEVNSALGSLRRELLAASVPEGSAKISDLFPDKVLAKAVRDKCGKFSIEDNVSLDELSKVTDLGYMSGLTDLTGIGNLAGLYSLKIEFQDVKVLPEELLNCKKMVSLSIRSTDITELPDWIGSMTSLTHLNCMELEIESIPDSIGSLENLQDLDFSGCKNVKALPDTIGNLRKLERLRIAYTGITALPDSIYNLTLKELDMSGLPIE